MQILNFLYFPSLIFKENYVFNEEDNPSQKVVMIEEEKGSKHFSDQINTNSLDLILARRDKKNKMS